MSITKYSWAVNKDKLNRAITRACQIERVAKNKQEARIRELYISYGGKIIDELIETIPETLSATPTIELTNVDNTTSTDTI